MKDIIVDVTSFCQSHFIKCAWIQQGQDINGQGVGENGYSVAISADGSTVAVGARLHEFNSGHVRVLTLTNDVWIQQGQVIESDALGDQAGYNVAISDNGLTVAIGAPFNDGNGGDSGHVRILKLIDNSWIQQGNDIDGEGAGDRSSSMSLSADGSIVAIGAYLNDGNGENSGHVRVYKFNGSAWTQQGNDIDGEAAGDGSGWSVAISADGTIVAIGSGTNDGNGFYSGHVRVYEFNDNAWTQQGDDIDGEAAGDLSGYSVAISADGKIVAIGALWNNGNGGHVRVYEFNGIAWIQQGDDIDGEAHGDESGYSVSLSTDGKIVAIGAPWNNGNGNNSGHVRVYKFFGDAWIQQGEDIDGKSADDASGWSVALSADGSTVAIGEPRVDQSGTSSGNVRIFRFVPPEQIGDATVFSGYCKDSVLLSCYKVVHDIGKNPENVDITLKGEGCDDDVPEGDEAIQVKPYKFDEGDIDFSYNVTVDFSKISNSGLIHYDDGTRNSTGEIKFCTHIITKKNISDETFKISSKKFDYSIKFDLTADINATFVTIDGGTTEVNETLDEFSVSACICPNDYECVNANELEPIEPNSYVDICLATTNSGVKISNFLMNLQVEGSSINYPVVRFGQSKWEPFDTDLTTITEEFGKVKVSTVVIFDVFTDSTSDVTAGGTVIFEFVDENESRRTTTFSTFSLVLSLADIDGEEVGCAQKIIHNMISLI